MSNNEQTHPSPAIEDPLVHRWLSSLPRLEPQSGFDERVLSRVWAPEPNWVRQLRRLAHRIFQRRLVWRWAVALAASSGVWLIGIAYVASTRWIQVETMAAVLGRYVLEGWRLTMQAIGASSALVMTWIELIRYNRDSAMLAAALTGLTMAVSAWGLRHTISHYEMDRGRLHVSR